MSKINNNKQKVIVLGGTGTFGHEMVKQLLLDFEYDKIIVFSRDEYKQLEMKEKIYNSYDFFKGFKEFVSCYDNDEIKNFLEIDKRLSFVIGSIRDRNKLFEVFKGVDVVIHAAAMKNIVTCELNPYEAIETNIIGAKNIIDASVYNNVKKVIGISTDKAVEPINLYGNTKACMEKLFIDANINHYEKTIFSIVRYGNVINSRGSVIPIWKEQKSKGEKLSLTSKEMTRFLIKIKDAVVFVRLAIDIMQGFEVFIPRMQSIKMFDLCKLIAEDEDENIKITGIRPGEKLHETLISSMQHDKKILYFHNKFIILPKYVLNYYENFVEEFSNYKNYSYSSNNNFDWVSTEKMKELIND